MHKRDEYLRNAEDYQDFRDPREYLRHVPLDLDEQDEEHGHARIFGKDGGGIIVEHHYGDGSVETHHFHGAQYAEAIDHLHRLVADDFIGKEEPSKGDSNEKY